MSIAEIGELKFCSQWVFLSALLSRVPLCVSWAFLFGVEIQSEKITTE